MTGPLDPSAPKDVAAVALTSRNVLSWHLPPWEALPPPDWADPTRCPHMGPCTDYPSARHCNQCGSPIQVRVLVPPNAVAAHAPG
jgi:hypothetical protein